MKNIICGFMALSSMLSITAYAEEYEMPEKMQNCISHYLSHQKDHVVIEDADQIVKVCNLKSSHFDSGVIQEEIETLIPTDSDEIQLVTKQVVAQIRNLAPQKAHQSSSISNVQSVGGATR